MSLKIIIWSMFLPLIQINCHTTSAFIFKLPSILSTFSSCTTILDLQNSSRLSIPVLHQPVILVNLPRTTTSYGEHATQQASFVSRKNTGKFCYAFVFILPDFENPSKREELSRATKILWKLHLSSPFVLETFVMQYFVCVTNFPMELIIHSSTLGGMSDLRGHLIFPTINNVANLNFHYLNNYFDPITEKLLPARIPISCLSFDCFAAIDSTTNLICRLIRLFWSYEAWWDLEESIPRVGHVKSQLAKNNPHRVVNLSSSFAEFMALWLFAGIENLTVPNTRVIFKFTPSRILLYKPNYTMDVVFLERETLNFLSCYAMGRRISTFGALVSPFDATTWLTLAFSLVLVSISLGRLLTSEENNVNLSFAPLVSFGVMLESSTMGGIEFNLLGKRGNVGFRLVLIVWVLSVGTVLTNWYKSNFTLEMIVPFEITAP